MTDPAPTLSPKLASDLKVRAISGFVLILIAAIELYMGGTFFVIFVAAMAAGMNSGSDWFLWVFVRRRRYSPW